MAKFIYNNDRNTSTGNILFELNYSYYWVTFFKENTNLCSHLKLANKLTAKLEELITVCQQNVYHAQKLQKQTYNKSNKPKNYIFYNKVWLNSK